jgi:bzd-type benzoyl-CoA reductase Q subunit
MTEEFWRWPESRWTSVEINREKANNVVAGVDVGVNSTQAVVMCDDKLYCYANMRTGPDGYYDSAVRAMEQALQDTGMKTTDIRYTVATGYGRKKVKFAQSAVNEVACHAKGARYMFGPTVSTVLDMGGETCKAIKLNEYGGIFDFAVNDKCSTGFGESIEMFADLAHVPIQEMGERSLSVKEEPELPVSTTCRIFAVTEAMGLLRGGAQENEILATYLFAIAWRLFTLIGQIEPKEGLAFTGGLAKNMGVVRRLETALKMTALPSNYDTQLAGAIGAALFAKMLAEKIDKKSINTVK